MTLKKLRRIAEGLNREYLKAGGESEIDFEVDAIRRAINDSVPEAFKVEGQLERGVVPRCLECLLPSDEAGFDIRCRNQPQVDPIDPEALTPMVPRAIDMAAQRRPGYCPGCNYHFVVPGETCPNCDSDDDDRPVIHGTEPARAVHKPEPAEGFQFCPNCGGEVHRSGGICPGCEQPVDAVYVPVFRPEDMAD